MEEFVTDAGLSDTGPGGDARGDGIHNGDLHRAIKKMDKERVRTMLTGSFGGSLEASSRSRMTAAPKLYAQLGYKRYFPTPWWLCTPLQYAAMYDTGGDVTTLLLRAGADVNNCGSLQASPLHIAAATKNKQFIVCLMNSRTPNSMHVDLELEDMCGRTPDKVSKDAEICDLISQLRDGNSESTKTEWQMVELTTKDASAEDPSAEHDLAICSCMSCEMRRGEEASAAIPIPGAGGAGREGSGDSDTALHDGSFIARSAVRFSSMVSKMFPPSKLSSKQVPACDDPEFRENFVIFCVIDFEELKLDSHRLAGGSFGDVFRGTWKGRTVAVKILRHVDFNDEKEGRALKRLLEEIAIFHELQHINIIEFLGASIENVEGKLYLCTEFATNGSLYDFLHSRTAEYYPETVSRWAIEIASGMKYLSQKNILHRDLKSANILLTRYSVGGSSGSGTGSDPTSPTSVDTNAAASATPAASSATMPSPHRRSRPSATNGGGGGGFVGGPPGMVPLMFGSRSSSGGGGSGSGGDTMRGEPLADVASSGGSDDGPMSTALSGGGSGGSGTATAAVDDASRNTHGDNTTAVAEGATDTDAATAGGGRHASGSGSEDPSDLICKICDFGLSHKVSKPKGSTVGTVRWMAPEALKRSEITLKSDVYSFGVVLWEMVSRRKPWKDFTDVQVLWLVGEDDKRPPIPEGFPPYITAILNECWRGEPKDRPAWADLIPALEAVDTKERWPHLAPEPSATAVAEDNDPSSFGTIGGSEGMSIGGMSGLGSVSIGGSISYSQECWSKEIDLAQQSMLSRVEMVDVTTIQTHHEVPEEDDDDLGDDDDDGDDQQRQCAHASGEALDSTEDTQESEDAILKDALGRSTSVEM